jgi:hypothetical protein
MSEFDDALFALEQRLKLNNNAIGSVDQLVTGLQAIAGRMMILKTIDGQPVDGAWLEGAERVTAFAAAIGSHRGALVTATLAGTPLGPPIMAKRRAF